MVKNGRPTQYLGQYIFFPAEIVFDLIQVTDKLLKKKKKKKKKRIM